MAIMDFNYGQAIRQADRVDDIADEMLRLGNRNLESTMNSIGTCWQGDASKQFLGYCLETQQDIIAQAKNLQSLSGRIRRVAEIIREAEEMAREIERRQAAAAAAAAAAASAAAKNKSGGGAHGGGGKAF